MKIILFLLALNMSLCNAQHLQFGPEVGFNLIKVETQDIGNNFEIGWHTGLFGEYEFKKWFSISSGLYYTQKKHNFNTSETISNPLALLLAQQGIEGLDLNTYSTTNGRLTLNYLQLPILAVFKHNNLNLKLGGYFGYMFNSRTKSMELKNTPFASVADLSTLLDLDPSISGIVSSFIPPANESNFTESTSKSGLSSIDFGLKAGITYQVNSIGFNLNYIYGLNDYRSSPSTLSFENNSYLQISIAYYFNKTLFKSPSRSKF